MSSAPNYTPGRSFADDETNNVAGRSIIKTDGLDSELADISASINALNANQQSLQRDDGKLQDSTVEPYALSEQTRALIAVAGCNPRGVWAPNTDYFYKDVIQRNNIAQICSKEEPHNSGSTFTQSFWLPISGDGTSAANAADAAASASAAATAQTNAAASAASASASASAASTSASAASTSATNAANSASSATTSATSATNSATAAATSASNAAASATSIASITTSTNDPTLAANNANPIASNWFNGKLNVTGSAPLYTCRAWVNFNGTGTVAIRASGNVSSITDNGVGDYTIGFTTPMPDANYSVVGIVSNTSQAQVRSLFTSESTPQTSSSVRVLTTSSNSGATTAQDPVHVMASIFR